MRFEVVAPNGFVRDTLEGRVAAERLQTYLIKRDRLQYIIRPARD